jgi:prolyl oligopeptidase
VKQGGERTGVFELLDIETRRRLPDFLPRGYLRGFAFAPDDRSFYYAHEALDSQSPCYRAAYRHLLGSPREEDEEIFFAGEGEKTRLLLMSDKNRLVFLVYRFLEKTLLDIYLAPFDAVNARELILSCIDSLLGLRLLDKKILAVTDLGAPNRKIVEIRLRGEKRRDWIDLIPESDVPICNWLVASNRIFVSYLRRMKPTISIFDLTGRRFGELPLSGDETVRMVGGSRDSDELLLETESFTEPVSLFRCSVKTHTKKLWARPTLPFDPKGYGHSQVWFSSRDGTRVPMYLVGRCDVLAGSSNPTIMTSYGGYGVSMTPQFSVLVAFLMERRCLFAVPNIRGGLEFGSAWHEAGKRRNRQTAYDDFLSAADWLIESGRTAPGRLAIFGGSNSGLLVGVAMTQRPELFRAVVCMVPLLDMLRYHLFDNAYLWKEEFGTAEHADDFAALARYSPYHQVRQGNCYPATMIVSGDNDQNCNPLHARKMTARLQAANGSGYPILLDYSTFRGHSPVLPLSRRVEALTDRVAFLCDQLQLAV